MTRTPPGPGPLELKHTAKDMARSLSLPRLAKHNHCIVCHQPANLGPFFIHDGAEISHPECVDAAMELRPPPWRKVDGEWIQRMPLREEYDEFANSTGPRQMGLFGDA